MNTQSRTRLGRNSSLAALAVTGLMAGLITGCSGGDAKTDGHNASGQNGCNGPNGCGGENGCNGPNGCNGAENQETKKN